MTEEQHERMIAAMELAAFNYGRMANALEMIGLEMAAPREERERQAREYEETRRARI